MNHKIAILLSGKGSNMEAIIRNSFDGILQDICTVAVVVSNNKDAPGLLTAATYGIPAFFVESQNRSREAFEEEVIQLLQSHDVEYLVLAGFMRILSSYILKTYHHRIINIHPADTQQYQGRHGYEWAFENRLDETMITVHYVDEGVDSGPIIGQRNVNLCGASTLEEVKKRGMQIEHQFYSEMLRDVLTTIS